LPRYGIDFTAIVDGNNAAPITTRQRELALPESLCEGGSRIRAVPTFLEQRLELLRTEVDAPRLLRLFTGEDQRITLAPVAQALRHFPATGPEQHSGYISQTGLVVWQVDRPHVFGVDPRPDDMRVPPTVLFVEDDNARLDFKAELALNLFGGLLEIPSSGGLTARRVEASREQVVLAVRSLGNGIGLAERGQQIIADEAAHLVQLDMIVIPHREQVTGKLRAAAAFCGLEDHGFRSSPAFEPYPDS